jgi:hypothetical protein
MSLSCSSIVAPSSNHVCLFALLCRRGRFHGEQPDDSDSSDSEGSQSDEDQDVDESPNPQPAATRTRKTMPPLDEVATTTLVKKQVTALIVFCGVDMKPLCPAAASFEDNVALAKQFRYSLEKSCTLTLCAVCAIPQPEVNAVHIDALPNKEILRGDGNSTPEAPRHGITVCTLKEIVYCLHPNAVSDEDVSVCKDCLSFLKRNKVPSQSLVRVDTGPIPRNPDPKLNLAPLRMLEERMVSVIRTLGKMVYIIKPAGAANLPPQCRQQCTKGHVIAFPNVTPQQIAKTLLLTEGELPQILQVVFLFTSSNRDDLEKMASTCKALRVRGPEVLKWALHLSQVRGDTRAYLCVS